MWIISCWAARPGPPVRCCSGPAQQTITWITSIMFWKGWTLVPAIWSGGYCWHWHRCEITSAFCYGRRDRKAGGRTCQLLSVSTFELGSQAMFFACAVWHDWAGRRYARAKKIIDQHLGFLTPLLSLSFLLCSLPLLLDPFLICLVFFSPCEIDRR